MIYLQLFWSFIKVGLFSIGGGYAAMPMIQNEVVTLHHWLSMTEFTDLITIAEMTPGPIAVNSATFVGIRIAGFAGALIATLGCILPSCFIVSLLSWIYRKYKDISTLQNILAALRPAVVALIAAAGCTIFHLAVWNGEALLPANTNWVSMILFALALYLIRKKKWSPILSMVLCGAAYMLINIGMEL